MRLTTAVWPPCSSSLLPSSAGRFSILDLERHSVYSFERLAQVQSPGYLDVAPELIVEVLSPDDRWSAVNDKLTEYFDVGVQVVWVADPQWQRVHVYRSLTEIEILTVGDTLTGGDLLPGFSVPVAELFE